MEDRFFGPFHRYKTVSNFDGKTNAKRVHFSRSQKSYVGISNLQHLQALSANNVDQGFLEEISQLKNLRSLTMKIVTASDFSCLSKLGQLKKICFQGAHKTGDFSVISKMSALKGFYVEHAKRLADLEFLEHSNHLRRVGIDGSMSQAQIVKSVEPFSKMKNLEELYLRNVRLRDKNLLYLKNAPKLKNLDCARFAPKKSFEELRAAMPKLKCGWCDKYELPKT